VYAIPMVLPNCWRRRRRRCAVCLFHEVDDYVGRVVCFVSFDFNVFFFERLEVSSAGETREACFDGVFVERLAFAEWNAAANIFVRKTLIAAEIEEADGVRRCGIEIEVHGRDVRRVVEG